MNVAKIIRRPVHPVRHIARAIWPAISPSSLEPCRRNGIASRIPIILAYFLGSVSYDRDEFDPQQRELLLQRGFTTPAQITQPHRPTASTRIARILRPQTSAQSTRTLRLIIPRNQPTSFSPTGATTSATTQPGTDDGWLFRPRGMYHLVGMMPDQVNDCSRFLAECAGPPRLSSANWRNMTSSAIIPAPNSAIAWLANSPLKPDIAGNNSTAGMKR